MKKQILILAAITTTVFISCSKEKLQTNQPDASVEMEMTSSAQRPAEPTFPTLGNGLLGMFKFNGTLIDATSQLTATSTVGRVIYTADRKGIANQAINFNGNYGLDIPDVPLGTDMSISVWVKTDMYASGFFVPFITATKSFALSQLENKYQMAYWNGINGQYVVSGNVGGKWHHIAATRTNKELSFYINGRLIGSSPTPAGSGPYSLVSEYLVGYGYNLGVQYWKGSLDDLRIYNRVLSATELSNLAKF
jgi:hypothetical protein